jgi:repressor LexA
LAFSLLHSGGDQVMSKGLTDRQAEILQFINNYINQNKYPPTLNEISIFFKISQKGSFDHIRALKKKKFISFDPQKKRSIKLLTYLSDNSADKPHGVQEIPILGTVHAGLPVLSYENFDGFIKLDNNIFGTGNFFGLKIYGDSMIDEGILEGDLAIIKCLNSFDNGEIIVVETGDGVTIKKGYKEKECLRLEPANKNYSPMMVSDVRIIGKLAGLIRKYF